MNQNAATACFQIQPSTSSKSVSKHSRNTMRNIDINQTSLKSLKKCFRQVRRTRKTTGKLRLISVPTRSSSTLHSWIPRRDSTWFTTTTIMPGKQSRITILCLLLESERNPFHLMSGTRCVKITWCWLRESMVNRIQLQHFMLGTRRNNSSLLAIILMRLKIYNTRKTQWLRHMMNHGRD